MNEDIRKMIDKVKNFKQFVNENYKYSYYDKPKESETFNPEYYLFTKLDGEGYDGDYNEFRNSDDYESYINDIQNTIDKIKSLKFPIRIYRGLNEKNVDLLKFHQHKSGNISWTHNLNMAKEFANGGVILTGVVNYDDVDIQATINRNVLHSMLYEDEIVLKDNKLIKDLNETIITTNIKVPKYLYHATFKPLLKKIKSEGLGGSSANQLWNDSKKGVVCLAIDANVAYSYTDTAFNDNEDIPESWEEKIIVLVIDTEKLDDSKFYIDSNVLDNEGETLEYHGVIPFDSVVKIMTTNDLYSNYYRYAK